MLRIASSIFDTKIYRVLMLFWLAIFFLLADRNESLNFATNEILANFSNPIFFSSWGNILIIFWENSFEKLSRPIVTTILTGSSWWNDEIETIEIEAPYVCLTKRFLTHEINQMMNLQSDKFREGEREREITKCTKSDLRRRGKEGDGARHQETDFEMKSY